MTSAIIIDEKHNVRLTSHSSMSETMGGITIKNEAKAVTINIGINCFLFARSSLYIKPNISECPPFKTFHGYEISTDSEY